MQLVAQLPWGHNSLLLEKVKEQTVRFWYMHQTIEKGWSRDTLNSMIKSNAYARQGSAVTNFAQRLPASQSEFARQLLKDPYIFDFMTLEEPFHERELEVGLIQHLEKFLLELGQGFAFVSRQYPLAISDKDFYLDLLFYHYRLHCFVVVELKRGEFKPEYAGKMNFYCSVVDDQVKQDEEENVYRRGMTSLLPNQPTHIFAHVISGVVKLILLNLCSSARIHFSIFQDTLFQKMILLLQLLVQI